MGRLVAFTGYATSGKDTAAKCLTNFGWNQVSFAAPLKEAVYQLNPIIWVNYQDDYDLRVQDVINERGWDRAKVDFPEVRALLQRMGTEVGRDLFGDNFWVDQLERKIEKHPHLNHVITDCRFPNEAEFVRKWGILIRVNRPGTEAVNAHVSDQGIANLKVDYEITNDGSIAELWDKVISIVGDDGFTGYNN